MITFDQARSIPIADVMAYLARQFSASDKRATLHHSTRKEDWYYSPFRSENTPSFKVDKKRNRWTDFGSNAKGYSSTIDLILDFRRERRDNKEAQREALKLLAAIDPNPEIKTVPDEPRGYDDRFQIVKRGPLRKCKKLCAIYQARGIDLDIAAEFVDHAVVKDTETGARVDCFAVGNIKGGTDVSHPTWKNCIGPKAPSVYPQKDGSAHIVLHGNKQAGQAVAEIILRCRFILISSSGYSYQCTRLAVTKLFVCGEIINSFPFLLGRQNFFSIRFLSARFSILISANIFLSSEFSFSRSRNLEMSLACMPPYLDFQL